MMHSTRQIFTQTPSNKPDRDLKTPYTDVIASWEKSRLILKLTLPVLSQETKLHAGHSSANPQTKVLCALTILSPAWRVHATSASHSRASKGWSPGQPVLCLHGSVAEELHVSSPFFHPENPRGTRCASLWHPEHKHSIQGASLPPIAPQMFFTQLSTSISTATATAIDTWKPHIGISDHYIDHHL